MSRPDNCLRDFSWDACIVRVPVYSGGRCREGYSLHPSWQLIAVGQLHKYFQKCVKSELVMCWLVLRLSLAAEIIRSDKFLSGHHSRHFKTTIYFCNVRVCLKWNWKRLCTPLNRLVWQGYISVVWFWAGTFLYHPKLASSEISLSWHHDMSPRRYRYNDCITILCTLWCHRLPWHH